MSTISARLLDASGRRVELAVRSDDYDRPPPEIRRVLEPDLRYRPQEPLTPVAPALEYAVYRYRGTDRWGWHLYVDEHMTPDEINAALREIYAPALRAQLAENPVWQAAEAVATHVTEEALREAARRIELGRQRISPDRGAFVRAVEAEMRAVSQHLAREAGGRLDEDGYFWPDAQVMTWDDDTEPFPW